VNGQNPVSALSIKQIQDIYLKKITNWQSVSGQDKEIMPFQRPENSGSQTAMIKEVMKGKKLPFEGREIVMGMGMTVRSVAVYRNEEESIGYSFRFFTQDMMAFGEQRIKTPLETAEDIGRVKLLDVDGVAPTEQNIRNGTYPLTVNVYAATAGTANPNAAALIAWLLSPQGQSLIEKTGYVGIN
jgi:phosphate transport system substrate-binding protein